MSSISDYLIDSDVLITAKNRYYAFQVCPGFWDSILHGYSLGYIRSIDHVKQELLRGHKSDDLVQWVRQSVPADFFLSSDLEDVITTFAQVIFWVWNHERYSHEAKANFANGADGWLVAHAVASGKTVVTNEQSSPESHRKIKLPDVCNAFSVRYKDTFGMLHELDFRYQFSPNT